MGIARTEMKNFTYTGLPARVLFGSNTTKRLPHEIAALGVSKALVLCTPSRKETASELVELMGDASAGVFSGATMHTPIEVTQSAMRMYSQTGADGVVSFGGGSAIGLGKAIALRTGSPQLALPTSYAGSEMTPIVGQTESGQKMTLRDLDALPETVIYDVNYTLELPLRMTVASAMNAMAHAVEALYSAHGNPLLSMMAHEGFTSIFSSLPKLLSKPTDPDARTDALYGAWICGMCLGSGGVALHHKLCHILGGSFDLPHAETHAIVLPHALAYNAPAISNVISDLRKATGSISPTDALYNLVRHAGLPTALEDLGMPEDGIARAVEITLEQSFANPRELERSALVTLLDNAWHGRRPAG